jgi:hypothetical protein
LAVSVGQCERRNVKLWKISQDVNDNYDTYDSAVVAAESEDEAKHMHPSTATDGGSGVPDATWGWAPPDAVTVEYIGEAKDGTQKGVICASFNAG